MKVTVIFSLMLIWVLASIPGARAEPIELQTPDGQTVILYPDRTWEYKRPPPTTTADTVELDALVENPSTFADQDVIVTGKVARLLGAYRLNSSSGQNNIVVDVERARRADQIKLEEALKSAGMVGTVSVQIQGRVQRGTVTWRLVARDIVVPD
jgi:hypothetical protein